MSVTPALRERVRLRAGFACEYCGVTEAERDALAQSERLSMRQGALLEEQQRLLRLLLDAPDAPASGEA